MSKHGMQMGPGGFGVTHGLKGGNHTPSSYDDGDRGGAHGVSDAWIKKRVSSAKAKWRAKKGL